MKHIIAKSTKLLAFAWGHLWFCLGSLHGQDGIFVAFERVEFYSEDSNVEQVLKQMKGGQHLWPAQTAGVSG